MITTKQHGVAFAAALSALATSRDGVAQSSLRIGGRNATAGVRNLRADQQTGPMVVPITTGGTLNVRPLGMGPGCLGWVTPQPDFILRVRSNVTALRFSVTSQRDTTLVVNAADGRWHCDDDSGEGLNPQLLVSNAGVGQYDVWVGSYASGAVATGELRIESVPFVTIGGQTATLGVRDLTADAPSDPLEIPLPSRPVGDIDASNAGNGCAGRVPRQPDLIVRVGATLPTLRASFTSSTDTTLMVRTPNNQWRCNDNASGSDPMVVLLNAEPGAYELWVGSKAEGAVTGRLQVTRAPLLETGGAAAALGVREVRPDLQPDPMTVEVPQRAAGAIAASMVDPLCRGYVSRQPDLIVRLPTEMPLLRAYVTSNADTTLVVHTPNGAWRCADDSYGSNPLVDIRGASPGQYEVWFGSYSSGASLSGQLHVSANENNHP